MLAILILVEPLDLRFPHKNICIFFAKKVENAPVALQIVRGIKLEEWSY